MHTGYCACYGLSGVPQQQPRRFKAAVSGGEHVAFLHSSLELLTLDFPLLSNLESRLNNGMLCEHAIFEPLACFESQIHEEKPKQKL